MLCSFMGLSVDKARTAFMYLSRKRTMYLPVLYELSVNVKRFTYMPVLGLV